TAAHAGAGAPATISSAVPKRQLAIQARLHPASARAAGRARRALPLIAPPLGEIEVNGVQRISNDARILDAAHRGSEGARAPRDSMQVGRQLTVLPAETKS